VGGLPHRVLPCPNAEACVRDAFWMPFRLLMGGEAETARIADVVRGRTLQGESK